MPDDRLRTEADVIRQLEPGAYELQELYAKVEEAGVAGRDGGYELVQDGQARFKRRVRNVVTQLKRQGDMSPLGDARWLIEGSKARPERAMLVLFGEPSEITLALKAAHELLREIDAPVDLILADPPYQLNVNQGRGDVGARIYARDQSMVIKGYVDVEPDREYSDFTDEWMGPAFEALRPGGQIAVVTGDEQAAYIQLSAKKHGLTYVNQIIVTKPFPLRTTKRFASSHSVVSVVTKGSLYRADRTFNVPPELPLAASGVSYPKDVWTDIPKYERPGRVRYANSLAPELVDRLVRTFSNEGDHLVYPFFGGGYIAVLCALTNRRLTAGDVNPESLRFGMARTLDVVHQGLSRMAFAPDESLGSRLSL